MKYNIYSTKFDALRMKTRSSPKNTLVLDLDETLVHSSMIPIPNSNFWIPVIVNGILNKIFVKIRPFASVFLKQLSRDYEIVIYTASRREYAVKVI
jgi:TFIIF-interacting CTD phosphatase-like protein